MTADQLPWRINAPSPFTLTIESQLLKIVKLLLILFTELTAKYRL